ncbi:hypothetical protein CPB85DRAFT_435595 [Mucidula mucida]|nr:hypothetical protein CPB85DRAFT_435595 [Mucidula mucida]
MNQNLSGLESRQRCLKDELACVERLISDAVAEKTRLGCSIATRKALLGHSPVQALPTEVLSQIFLDYNALSQTAQENVFEEIVAYHRIHTPILSVCRRWRSTALADPRLWTTIPLIGSGGEDKSYSHPLLSESPEERATYWNALQSVIERTSALPLQLLLHVDVFDIGTPFTRFFRYRHSSACSHVRTPSTWRLHSFIGVQGSMQSWTMPIFPMQAEFIPPESRSTTECSGERFYPPFRTLKC